VITIGKVAKTVITLLTILLLAVIAALIIIVNLNLSGQQAEQEPTIEEVVEYSYETPEVTTDLADGTFIRIQFQILTNGQDALDEITTREFQVRNIIIKELTQLTEEEMRSGIGTLEDTLQTRLNEIMTDGNVTDVVTISKIMQ